MIEASEVLELKLDTSPTPAPHANRYSSAWHDGKVADGAHLIDTMLNTTGTASARSGFLAGFAYYELSRLSEANADRVPLYLGCLLGAFTLSVTRCAVLVPF